MAVITWIDPPPLADAIAERIAGIKREAHALLQPSDWYVVRQQETGEPVPENVSAYRASVRAAADAAEADVLALTNAEAVLAYQAAWPANRQPEP